MLKACKISKSFGTNPLLNEIDFTLEKGFSCAIIGRSGEGKSTLLHILGSLENPDSGELFMDNQKIEPSSSEKIRKNSMGFIFQNFNVLEDFSVLDNLKIASLIRGTSYTKEGLLEHLDKVNLKAHATTMARYLSGGEKQRLAIARALMHQPKLVLADEPTGSLDQTQALQIEQLLLERVKQGQTSLIIVTHDLELAKKCDRILHLKDGKLKEYL
jgi:lipoprotein-releasing system ATP-binding protein